ncbi:MAG: zinc ribbon domain-containing protein [Actinobacteria bacterium]|nr:MAG: zinc ribbon domain-containing protein [Actinomycetota bacterium]
MESTTASHEAPTAVQPALATVAGDQCTSCGAPLAPDQRYCVQCGQRRGQSQLPVAQPVAASAPRRESRMPRMSQNAALIAGVGVLLLAMQKSGSAAAAPQIVTVGGSGANTAAAAGAGGAAAKGGKAAKTKSTGKKATAAQAQSAANKIKGTSVKLPKKAVVTVGSPGTGPGYHKGKFDGNFFGGG